MIYSYKGDDYEISVDGNITVKDLGIKQINGSLHCIFYLFGDNHYASEIWNLCDLACCGQAYTRIKVKKIEKTKALTFEQLRTLVSKNVKFSSEGHVYLPAEAFDIITGAIRISGKEYKAQQILYWAFTSDFEKFYTCHSEGYEAWSQ